VKRLSKPLKAGSPRHKREISPIARPASRYAGETPAKRCHTGTSSKEMRENRIRTRGSPQLRAAFAAGEITCYRADEIAKLPADQQKIALGQWTSRSLCRSRGQAIAAKVIRRALRRRARVDLGEIAEAIRAAIALATPSPNHTFVKTRAL
jgi:hypothetical protein